MSPSNSVFAIVIPGVRCLNLNSQEKPLVVDFLSILPTSHFSASDSASAAPGTYRYVLQKTVFQKRSFLHYVNQNLLHVLHVTLHVITCNENLHVKKAKVCLFGVNVLGSRCSLFSRFSLFDFPECALKKIKSFSRPSIVMMFGLF